MNTKKLVCFKGNIYTTRYPRNELVDIEKYFNGLI